MKINITALVIIAFFLSGCNSAQPEVSSTFTPVSTKIIQPTETPTISPTSAELEITTISKENQDVIKGFHAWVNLLFWSKDGKKLFIGTQDKGVIIYDMVNNKMFANFENGLFVKALALSPDENILAVAIYGDDSIRLIDSETGELIKVLYITWYWPVGLIFSPDNRILASYNDRSGETILWDVATGKEIKRLENSGVGRFFSLDGTSFTTSSAADGVFRVWNTSTWELQETVHCKISGGSSFSPDKNRFVVLGFEMNTKENSVWDFKSCKKLFDLTGAQPWPSAVAYDPTGKYIAAGGSGGNDRIIHTITLWDANTGKHIRDLVTGYYFVTNALAFNPDGSKLASATGDESGLGIIIWDLTQQ